MPLFVLHRGFATYPKPVAAPAAEIVLWMVTLLLRYSGTWGRTGNLDSMIDVLGGRCRDRTCDPLHVKEVLFR